MTTLGAIGTPHQIGSLRREEIPVGRVQEPGSEQQQDERSQRAEKPPQTQRAELPTRTIHARLNYDRDANEVVVEILNPQTGDVLRQFPAEELPEDIRALVSETGPLANTFA